LNKATETTKPKKNKVPSLTESRRAKLSEIQSLGISPFATGFTPSIASDEFRDRYSFVTEEESSEDILRMVGRIMASRVLGKAAFLKLQDAAGDYQAYLARDFVGKDAFKFLKKLDVGDIVGIEGTPFRTRTGELSILAREVTLLTKSLRPLPEKWHGLTDVETRYRQRYVDLIVNPAVRESMRKRSLIVTHLREFLCSRGFLEVETPMMQPIPGGATAKPFETYHHSLDRNLYLRIAPELYLKRLLVGGFDKVFEINRNFRNEGISTQHNPEFTMLEFYQAFATYHDLMEMTEEMIRTLAEEILGTATFPYGDREIDLGGRWERITVRDALLKHAGITEQEIEDRTVMLAKARAMGLEISDDSPLGKIRMEIFDEKVEPLLWGPVFVHQYPVEVSPLARRNEQDPTVTDRFELYMAGREIANAFTELTDPVDQRERFEAQVMAREAGDEEAHFLDEDFLRALEYGMPPAAGEGVGIDRLVMLLTDSHSIRDVILFPHMRPEKGLE
jgi:lysyl-tRNA synthetase class 2